MRFLDMRIATRIVECVRRPVTIDGHEVQVGASIGIAIGDGTQDAEALLRDADIAMYRAKQTGKSRCELFDAALGAQVLERVGLEFELRRARERGQLALHYQPIVTLADGRIAACEALMRWQHPELGPVSPDRFIPIAEETGLIAELGAWALDTAWQTEVPRNAILARNLGQIVESLQSLPRHNYGLFLIDYTNKNYAKSKFYEEAVKRWAPFTGTNYEIGVTISGKPVEIYALLGGQWPHSCLQQKHRRDWATGRRH